jgi:8-oxo-dGTP pyrophosphatase MutT (NUDIX family)
MAHAERNKAVTAVYLFLKKDGKILLARRCNTGYQDGNYQVPAGHIDAGELPTQAAIREGKEEVGIDIVKEDLRFVHASFRPKHDNTGDRVDYFFEVSRWSGEIANGEPDKCDELRWVDPAELPQNVTPHVRVAIECAERGEMFSELGIDFLKQSGMYQLEGV